MSFVLGSFFYEMKVFAGCDKVILGNNSPYFCIFYVLWEKKRESSQFGKRHSVTILLKKYFV